MYKAARLIVFMTLLICPFIVQAEDTDITVGDVELSGMRWGDQTINVELTNNSDFLKFVVAEISVDFQGTYMNPSVKTSTNYTLVPGESVQVKPAFRIPGNYGKANVELKLYSVIDTLDELLPRQTFYTQPFELMFHIPDSVLPYLQERISLPPRVEENPLFNNEFARLLFIFLKEGKSLQEIADMNKCDLSFVEQEAKLFTERYYLRKKDSTYEVTFPVISKEEAEGGRAIAEKVADSLTKIIGANMKDYWTVVDSLVKAKAIPNDSNDFISGASLIFKPTPVVTSFVMWYELGRRFITRSAPLLIYDGTDICNAGNIQYMYEVEGGPYLNGENFFALFFGDSTSAMMFSYKPVDIKCNEDAYYIHSTTSKGKWNYNHPNYPEYFIMDTTKIRPLIDHLTKNCQPLLDSAYNQLKENAYSHGQDNVYIGHRYWFWNLVSTMTIKDLQKDGILKEREYKFFRFDKLKGH